MRAHPLPAASLDRVGASFPRGRQGSMEPDSGHGPVAVRCAAAARVNLSAIAAAPWRPTRRRRAAIATGRLSRHGCTAPRSAAAHPRTAPTPRRERRQPRVPRRVRSAAGVICQRLDGLVAAHRRAAQDPLDRVVLQADHQPLGWRRPEGDRGRCTSGPSQLPLSPASACRTTNNMSHLSSWPAMRRATVWHPSWIIGDAGREQSSPPTGDSAPRKARSPVQQFLV
jgi:hypothetical protein